MYIDNRSLRFHAHIRRSTRIAGAITTNLLSCTLSHVSEFIMNVYTAHVRPQFDYASCLWNTGYIGDLKLQESIKRKWTKAIFEMSKLSYGDRLKALNLFSFKGRLIRADLIMKWKILNNKCSIELEGLFAISPVQFTRVHHYKNFPTQCSLDVRQRFFCESF